MGQPPWGCHLVPLIFVDHVFIKIILSLVTKEIIPMTTTSFCNALRNNKRKYSRVELSHGELTTANRPQLVGHGELAWGVCCGELSMHLRQDAKCWLPQ